MVLIPQLDLLRTISKHILPGNLQSDSDCSIIHADKKMPSLNQAGLFGHRVEDRALVLEQLFRRVEFAMLSVLKHDHLAKESLVVSFSAFGLKACQV